MRPRPAVVDLPSPLPRRAYEAAAEELDGLLAGLPETIAVYATGAVSAPGISDLDRIVVLDRPVSGTGVWSALDPTTRRIAGHTAFITDRAGFTNHRWFALLEPLTLISGEEILIEEPPAQAYLDRLTGIESAIVTLLRVRKELDLGRIKARSSLCALHSLRHSLDLIDGGNHDEQAWRLVQDVTNLRMTWFEMEPCSREEALVELVEAAPAAIVTYLVRIESQDTRVPGGAMSLQAPWANVELVPGFESKPMTTLAEAVILAAARRPRRLGEAVWRARRRRAHIPSIALSLLDGAPGQTELRGNRDRLIARYEAFATSCGSGWSRLGFAAPFTAPRRNLQ